MTQAWNRVSKQDKLDAKELALDMLRDGESPEDIAEAYAASFILTANPRIHT